MAIRWIAPDPSARRRSQAFARISTTLHERSDGHRRSLRTWLQAARKLQRLPAPPRAGLLSWGTIAGIALSQRKKMRHRGSNAAYCNVSEGPAQIVGSFCHTVAAIK